MKGKRTPIAIKRLQGSVNVTRELKNAVSYSGVNGLPDPPSVLDEVGRGLWLTHGKALNENGLLSDVNLWALEGFCFSWQIARAAAEKIGQGDRDAFRTWRDAMDKASQYGAKFGFDPQSATKVAGSKQKEEVKDPFEDAVNGTRLKIAK